MMQRPGVVMRGSGQGSFQTGTADVKAPRRRHVCTQVAGVEGAKEKTKWGQRDVGGGGRGWGGLGRRTLSARGRIWTLF